MVNCKRKGNKGENELCQILNKRFGTRHFKRTAGSGAFTGGKNSHRAKELSAEQASVFIGDLITPPDFAFSIEHKSVKKFDFWEILNRGSYFWKWVDQARADAEKAEKDFMLVIKPNMKPRLVVTAGMGLQFDRFFFFYRGLVVMYLDDFLDQEDEYFFIKEK